MSSQGGSVHAINSCSNGEIDNMYLRFKCMTILPLHLHINSGVFCTLIPVNGVMEFNTGREGLSAAKPGLHRDARSHQLRLCHSQNIGGGDTRTLVETCRHRGLKNNILVLVFRSGGFIHAMVNSPLPLPRSEARVIFSGMDFLSSSAVINCVLHYNEAFSMRHAMNSRYWYDAVANPCESQSPRPPPLWNRRWGIFSGRGGFLIAANCVLHCSEVLYPFLHIYQFANWLQIENYC